MKILTKKFQGFFPGASLTCDFEGTWGRNPPQLKKNFKNSPRIRKYSPSWTIWCKKTWTF